MPTIGIDLEQFIRDPYATGIQRVLQQLAMHWPSSVDAHFVIPLDDGTFALIDPSDAAALLSLPFDTAQPPRSGIDPNHVLRLRVSRWRDEVRSDRAVARVTLGQMLSIYDGWLLPEVSYLPSVLERLELFRRAMPVTMIGYDALPMTDPANYRFVPGSGRRVSEYFRQLSTADSVVCISEYSRTALIERLRRDVRLSTTVAHPGADHLPLRNRRHRNRGETPTFLRVGTMEHRKQPLEILRAFRAAVDGGARANLLFVGGENASHSDVNVQVQCAMDEGYPVAWIRGATDDEVHEHMHAAAAFLSVGIEGYGIPVLEAIRLGTPVLFAGVQPAAELMQGKGAHRISRSLDGAEGSLTEAFGDDGLIAAVSAQVSPVDLPTWGAFAHDVSRAASV